MQLKVSYEGRHDGITVVRVETDGPSSLDGRTAPELREVLVRLVEDGRLILVVDMGSMDDMDSTGLGMLAGERQRVHVEGGTLSLVVTSGRLRAILSKTGLTRVFRVHSTMSSAVATLAADYAEKSVEQRRAAIEEQALGRRAAEKGPVISGDHTYEHLSEEITLVRVMDGQHKGVLDPYTVAPLRKLLVDLVNQGRYFHIVDLTAVDFIDSTGLGMLVGCRKWTRAHAGAMALVVPSESVLKGFRITGLTKAFPIFDTVDPAVEYLGRRVSKAHV